MQRNVTKLTNQSRFTSRTETMDNTLHQYYLNVFKATQQWLMDLGYQVHYASEEGPMKLVVRAHRNLLCTLEFHTMPETGSVNAGKLVLVSALNSSRAVFAIRNIAGRYASFMNHFELEDEYLQLAISSFVEEQNDIVLGRAPSALIPVEAAPAM